eukprot:8047009-Prorocentrum_lima.AAC.1
MALQNVGHQWLRLAVIVAQLATQSQVAKWGQGAGQGWASAAHHPSSPTPSHLGEWRLQATTSTYQQGAGAEVRVQ